jgi:xanthine/CO dehydrogenase XdhC/CoxF family maturation factor
VKELGDIVRLWEARAGARCALATLVRTTGSSYRRTGARMLITSSGETAGALSAGCIEEEVAMHALDVIASGEPKLVTFDTRRRFGCSGSIEIFVQPVDDAWIAQLRGNLAIRQTFELTTEFAPHSAFVQTIEPVIRLLVFGDGADADPFSAQAKLLGWDVQRFSAISDFNAQIDGRTAALVATHNFGRDCAALRHLLPLGLRYLGLVGPKRRREELLIDVIDSGAAAKSELFAPAGLHIAAETPEEIAVSVVAEIQSVFGGGTAEHLRDRRAPIHASAAPECATSAR